MLLRPERLRVLGATQEAGPGFNLLQATLLNAVYQETVRCCRWR